MRPACLAGAGRDSSNAFILRFAGAEGVFVFRIVLVLVLVLDLSWAGDENGEEDASEDEFISALVSQPSTLAAPSRGEIERSANE